MSANNHAHGAIRQSMKRRDFLQRTGWGSVGMAGLIWWELRTKAPLMNLRLFKFKNFADAFAFMTSAAFVAEKLDHHPEWSNVYNRVHVALTTHDSGGITELDFAFAARAVELSRRYVV